MPLFQSELDLQLSEIEMLQSMFPGENEMRFDHSSSIVDVQQYVDGKRQALPKQLTYTLNMSMESGQVRELSFIIQGPIQGGVEVVFEH